MADDNEIAKAGPPQVTPVDPYARPIDEKGNITGNIMSTPGAWPEFDGSQLNGLTFKEIGTSGLRAFSGWVKEEILYELQGRQGAQKYREMGDNSPTIGGMLFAIQSTMRKVEWRVVPNEDAPQGPAQEAADFVEGCMNDMSHTWSDLMIENLSALQYGYAPHEIVYKRRMGKRPPKMADGTTPASSDYEDGKIGWRRMPLRGQDTILQWFFDSVGTIKGLRQLPWTGIMRDIPIEKMLLFRPMSYKNNPEGRPLPLDTPVRTPSGWTTMGEIAIGDQVYDETGARRRVVGKSEVFKDRPIYEIEFTTGATIRADACHLWRVSTHNDRFNGKGETRDLTTEQIARELDLGKPRHFSCGIAPVLESKDVELPLDPYLLGYWLGDGVHTKAAIAAHPKDFPNLKAECERLGFEANHDGDHTARISNGFLFGLRAAGVMGNKHVPAIYLNASSKQRLALLQGLMDSDGYSPGIDSRDEASTFANTNLRLVAAVVELVRTLGGQPRVRVLEEVGALGGIINGKQIVARQTSYEVRFMLDQPVHRLPRKKHAQIRRRTNRNSAHFIRSVQLVGKADTVCIEVDSPSHLFLAGESMVPTHNSILRNAYVPYYYIKRLQEQEAIMGERMGGVPVVKVPLSMIEAANAGNAKAIASMNSFKNLAVNLRIDEQMGVVMPSDFFQGANGPVGGAPQYELTLVTPQGGRGTALNFEAAIGRYSISMLTSVLADFLTLGHEARGTQSLAVTKVDLFFQAVEGFLNNFASVYNKYALTRLWELNNMDFKVIPTIEPDLAQRVDLDVLSNFVLRLSQAGMPLFPNEDLQTFLLDAGGLPDVSDPRALQAAGLLDDQLDMEDEKDQVSLDQMKNPPQPALPGAKPPARSNLDKMLLASLARRMIRKAGPRFGISQ